jgi:Sigma-54 interaction domain
MDGAPPVDVDASVLDGYDTEWRILSEQPCNVLVEGTVADTDVVLRLLRPHIREPIVRHGPPAALDLPVGETRALVLTHAAALSRNDQRRLLAWMDGQGSRAQIITTASRPLFALVVAGRFDAALYYRLNIVLLRVGAHRAPRLASRACPGASVSTYRPCRRPPPPAGALRESERSRLRSSGGARQSTRRSAGLTGRPSPDRSRPPARGSRSVRFAR